VGSAESPETTRYVHDRGQVVLELDGDGYVTHRYLWGPETDQLLADEQVGAGVNEVMGDADDTHDVYWALSDHENTVRDLVDNGQVMRLHRQYDSFGNLLAASYRNGKRPVELSITHKSSAQFRAQVYVREAGKPAP
jgi:hypothetical protein